MLDALSTWVPDFSVWMIAQNVVPLIGAGFVLAGVFWLVGYVVDFLLSVLRGGFFWTR